MITEREQGEIARQSDRQLVSRFVAERDESAFREIVRRYGPLVLGVCRRVLGEMHDAEDAFQATFLVLARNARKIRRRRSLSCWLHGVAYRVSVRAAKRTSRHMELLLDDQADGRPSVLECIAHRHDERTVDEALNELPEKDRESLALRYLEDLSNGEIAERMEISVSAVESRLKRAKSRLRRQLVRRGVTLSAFMGVLVESRIELQAVESLIPGTVELGLSDASGELIDSSAAHELAVTEIGEMIMISKQMFAVAAVAVMTCGLGFYGLSAHAVGQDSTDRVTVVNPIIPANAPSNREVRMAAATDQQATDKRQSRRRATSTGGVSSRLAKAQKISDALGEEVTMEFDETPLEDVVDYLETTREFPIMIDRRALDDVGLGSDVPVTVSLRNFSFRTGLKLMLKELTLDYTIRDEVLTITTEEAARKQLDPRVYRLDSIGSDRDQLIEWITEMVAPETWDGAGGTGKIRSMGSFGQGVLIAQTCQIHDEIAEFLEKLRRGVSE